MLTLLLLKIARKNITHFHGSGALSLNEAMSTEQTNQIMGVAEGIIRELQD